MEYENNILALLKRNAIRTLETYIAARLTSNEWTDTFTDIAAGGLRGGALEGRECREWIFVKQPTGKTELAGIRVFMEKNGEKELNSADEIVFGDKGEVKGYRSGMPGKHPESTYDKMWDVLGGARGITGGIIFGERGDIDEVQDKSRFIAIAKDLAITHYMEKGRNAATRKLLKGKDEFGREIYTIKIPMTENDFTFLDPREYDLGLIGKNLNLGTWYFALKPFFEGGKKALKKLKMHPDGISEIQMSTAYELSKSPIGGLGYFMYPAFCAYKAGKKLLYDDWGTGAVYHNKNKTTH